MFYYINCVLTGLLLATSRFLSGYRQSTQCQCMYPIYSKNNHVRGVSLTSVYYFRIIPVCKACLVHDFGATLETYIKCTLFVSLILPYRLIFTEIGSSIPRSQLHATPMSLSKLSLSILCFQYVLFRCGCYCYILRWTILLLQGRRYRVLQ